MNEYEIIKRMAKKFPRSPDQDNRLFECDAELIRMGNELWGLTLDDFSPEEDLFSSDDPGRLGENLAVATLSDLLAAGAEPKFFMHALSLPKEVEPDFLEGLMEGIAAVLAQAGCALLGGDTGTAETWRFCGFAMGPVTSRKPLTHILPEDPQTLWITGVLGDANVAALSRSETPRFELRLQEAKLIREFAGACIDTSGGFFDALWLLHEQNPRMRFEIHGEKLPVAEPESNTNIPKEAALFGGAGEYELLFAAPQDLPAQAKAALRDAGMIEVGIASIAENPGIFVLCREKNINALSEPPPCPREAGSIEAHVKEAVDAARTLFGYTHGTDDRG